MASISSQYEPTALGIPEIVQMVISHVHDLPDLLSCACVNSMWSFPALKNLYRGSLNDMKLRTPSISALNKLFLASRKRFTRNMAMVEHLLLCPMKPAIRKDTPVPGLIVCREKFRALRDSRSGKSLLQAAIAGSVSASLPFHFDSQDFSILFDLLLHPGLECLTIDNQYCSNLLSSLSRLSTANSISNPALELSKLEALSVHWADESIDIRELCNVLDICDLKVFNFQTVWTGPDVRPLLSSLWTHTKLRALSIFLLHLDCPLGEMLANTLETSGRVPWPELQGLYLDCDVYESLLERLTAFQKLEIVEFNVDGTLFTTCETCFRQLSVIDIRLEYDLEPSEGVRDLPRWLLNVAQSNPTLRKLRIKNCRFRGIKSGEFSAVLKALPHLEFLSLDCDVQDGGSPFRELADYCPRLILLDLGSSDFDLSYKALTTTAPLCQLEQINLSTLWFRKPWRFKRLDRLHKVVTEWRRVFPAMSQTPCLFRSDPEVTESTTTLLRRYKSRSGIVGLAEDSSDLSDDGDDEDEAPTSVPDGETLRKIDTGVNLLRSVWKALGYTDRNWREDQRITQVAHMWQTDFEIKTFRWPIVPFSAFKQPDEFGTTNKHNFSL